MPSPVKKGEKVTDTKEVAGPASYDSADRPTVSLDELVTAQEVVSVQITGGYEAEEVSVSGNTVTVQVNYADYDAGADGALIEVANATDISGETISVTARGV